MADPFAALTEILQSAIGTAFGPDFASTDPVIRASEHADFQANAAMALAKTLQSNPREVAQKITDSLHPDDVLESVEVAGPGFLNLMLKETFIEKQLMAAASDDRLGVDTTEKPERIVMDYSAPNVAKEMHIGHLRSTIIGDCLVRVFDFLGHDVIRQNHIGDWGTPYGMLIEHLIDLGENEAAHELSVGDFDKFYKEARKEFDSDPEFADRARARVVKLQGESDPETTRLWKLLIDLSATYFNRVYTKLGVLLTDDDLYGESKYNADLPVIAKELEDLGLAVIDDGALCVFPPGFTNREGKPLPVIIRKSGGGYNYATADLALVRYRVRVLKADRSYHVVGSPQREHFAAVWTVARMAGWMEDAHFEHVPFGSVLGEDRKMFKTRAGEAVKLIDLLDEAEMRAAVAIAERNPDLPPDEAAATAHAIGIGAVKYADLSNDRIKDYVFDFDRMLSFEGNTAPYLQYAHARICSIFRKAEIEPDATKAIDIRITNDEERSVALLLLAFGGVVREVADTLQPHRLCTYLFELASEFTGFYEKHSVLNAETDELKASRLALSYQTARHLKLGLSLLGIDAPARM